MEEIKFIESSGICFSSWDKIIELNQKIFNEIFPQPYGKKEYEQKIKENVPADIFLAVESEKENPKSLEDTNIIGDLISFKQNENLYIWIMGVEKNYRNRGIGKGLLNLCEDSAIKSGGKISCVTAKVYNVSPDMQRLLIKQGYIITDFKKDEKDAKYNSIIFSKKIH